MTASLFQLLLLLSCQTAVVFLLTLMDNTAASSKYISNIKGIAKSKMNILSFLSAKNILTPKEIFNKSWWKNHSSNFVVLPVLFMSNLNNKKPPQVIRQSDFDNDSF